MSVKTQTPRGEEPPCPITHRPYFMHIEHPNLGDVPTYGGPFDSYTTPEPDEDGHFHSEHYCHDRGDWIEGGNAEGLMLITEREYNELTIDLNTLRAANEGLRETNRDQRRERDALVEALEPLTSIPVPDGASDHDTIGYVYGNRLIYVRHVRAALKAAKGEA